VPVSSSPSTPDPSDPQRSDFDWLEVAAERLRTYQREEPVELLPIVVRQGRHPIAPLPPRR